MLASLLRIILLTATLKILERGLDKGPIIGDASFQIIPKGYDWEHAVKFHVKVLPQNPVKELRFEDMQKELSIRKKKSIKEQIKKFLRNHNIIHV